MSEVVAAILTVSLANAVLLLWLGLTVLLNADRRTWGMWLACAALLLGGIFFVMQGSEAAYGWVSVVFAVHFQWPLGWFIGLSLPLAWYVVMLWHAGFSESREAPVRRGHRVWLWAVLLFAAVVFWSTARAYRYPATWRAPETIQGEMAVPLLAAMYAVFIALCIILSIHALSHPAPSDRMMGDLAYRRSRPWLLATSAGLLSATVVLGGIMVLLAARPPRQAEGGIPLLAVWGVLIVSALILVSVLLLGQAVVAYEIFTGKTLPRGGLRQHWHWAVLLALGYGIIVGRSVAVGSLSGLGLPMVTLLLAVLFALTNWRSYSERQRYIDHLRPFVSSPRVYDALVHPDAAQIDAATPFGALCEKVLDTQRAYLITLGPLSALAGPPLAYPPEAEPPTDVSEMTALCTSPGQLFLAVDPARYGLAQWAVPLWSERGLIGLLLLGAKTGGGLYTQEEMEIARASGERLIDTVACARMAQRLMTLQRQWLSDSRLTGRQTRRVLHDDVLPQLHALMLSLSGSSEARVKQAVRELADTHRRLSSLLQELPTAGASEVAALGLAAALKRSIDDEFASSFDAVEWTAEPLAEQKARDLPPSAAEVLFHAAREAVRNAARHGRGDHADGALKLSVGLVWRNGLEVTVEDNGVGFDTSQYASTGHGTAIHSTLMAVIGGAWVTESSPGKGTRVTLTLPEGAWQ
jgi:two-component sensor histidine kinase